MKHRHLPMTMESVRQGLVEQLRKSVLALREGKFSKNSAHEMRSALTRARALVRLLRVCIGERAYHQYNIRLRDIGRQLTSTRDAQVLIQTVHGLHRATDAKGVSRLLGRLEEGFAEEYRRVHLRSRALRKARASLQWLVRDTEEISSARLRAFPPQSGLARAYKNCRIAFRRAQHKPSDARLHEWRKQAKYFYCQTLVLSQSGYTNMAKAQRQSSQLTGHLGKDHDLAVLQAKVGEARVRAMFSSQPISARELMARVSRLRSQWQGKSQRMGTLCYDMHPRRFERSLKAR